jgi:hypothetical protein
LNHPVSMIRLILPVALLAGDAIASFRVETIDLALVDGGKYVGGYQANPFEGRVDDVLNRADGSFGVSFDFRSDGQFGDFQIMKADLSNGSDLVLRLQITTDQTVEFDLSGDFLAWSSTRDSSPYGMINFANVSQDLMRNGALNSGGYLDPGSYDLVFELRSGTGSGIGGSNFALRLQVVPVASPTALALVGLALVAAFRSRRQLS